MLIALVFKIIVNVTRNPVHILVVKKRKMFSNIDLFYNFFNKKVRCIALYLLKRVNIVFNPKETSRQNSQTELIFCRIISSLSLS